MADEDGERGKVWGLVAALPFAVVLGFLNVLLAMAVLAPPHQTHLRLYQAVTASVIGSASAAGLVWGVLYVSFIRHRAPQRSLGYFVILFVTILVFDGGLLSLANLGVASDDARAQADQATTLREIPQLVHVAYSLHGGTYKINSLSAGEGGVVARAALEWMKAVSGSRELYESDLRALNPGPYMQAAQLAAPGGLTRARAVLAKMRGSAARHRAEEAAATARFRTFLAGSSVDPAMKGRMFMAFDTAVARERVAMDAIYADEDGVVTEYGAILARLAHPDSVWYLDGHVIRFASNADLAAFKAHATRADQYDKDRHAVFDAPSAP